MIKTCFLLILFPIFLLAQNFEPTHGFTGGTLYELTAVQNTLFALTFDGLIKSEDAGMTWQISNSLPFNDGFYNNRVSSSLIGNDSLIFVMFTEEIGGEDVSRLQFSSDLGDSWQNVTLPSGIFWGNNMGINEQYFYVWTNSGTFCIDLQQPDFELTTYTEPPLTNKRRYFYQNHAFLHNRDSVYFSEDNENWTLKFAPADTEFTFSGSMELALVNEALYAKRDRNLFKATLPDGNFIAVDTTYNSDKIVAEGDYLYFKPRNASNIHEIHPVNNTEVIIEGTTYDFLDELVFTDTQGFVISHILDPEAWDETSYSPVIRFSRFSNQPASMQLIRSDFDREYTTNLVVLNNELFNCSHRGLYRYQETENLWTFVPTPTDPDVAYFDIQNVQTIGWHNNFYFLATNNRIYRSADLMDWEEIDFYFGDVQFIKTSGEKLYFFGRHALSVSTDNGETWVTNESVLFQQDGTYPDLIELFSPAISNDTLFMVSAIEAFGEVGFVFSIDEGQTWSYLFSPFQTDIGFIGTKNFYYFNRYFNVFDDEATVYFTKAPPTQPVNSGDYSTIYNDIYVPNQGAQFNFLFFQDDQTLFHTLNGVGILHSIDDGEHWELLANDLNSLFVTNIAATEDYYYFASRQAGVRRLKKSTVGLATPNLIQIYTFPNPTTNFIYLQIGSNIPQNSFWRLYSLDGQLIQSVRINQQFKEMAIEVSNVLEGLYIQTIETERKVFWSERVVVGQ